MKSRYIIGVLIILILISTWLLWESWTDSTYKHQHSYTSVNNMNDRNKEAQILDETNKTSSVTFTNNEIRALEETETDQQVGNSAGNLMNSGRAVLIDGMLAYYDFSNGALIVGSESEIEFNDGMSFMNYFDPWLYFSDRNAIKRLRTDEFDVEIIRSVRPSYMQVISEWIYYCRDDFGNQKGIYKMKNDGTEHEIIFQGNISSCIIEDDWFYFYSDGYLSKMKLDGSEFTKLSNDSASNLIILADELYYINHSDQNSIYSIGINGEKRSVVYDRRVTSFNISDGWIYFADSESEIFFKIKINGTNLTKISEDWAYDIQIVGDELLFRSRPKNVPSGDGPLVIMDLDGSNRRILSEGH